MAAKAPKATTHARPKAKGQGKDPKDKTIATPTDFGSHASMTNEESTARIPEARQDAADPWVILADERGHYATRKSRLDSGMADPNRYADIAVREKLLNDLTAA
jgi:hypothetical protein